MIVVFSFLAFMLLYVLLHVDGGVGVVAHAFHFERSPDEGAYALGVVVADGFAHVVVERAIALGVLGRAKT